MTWKIVQARSIGTAHVENGAACQDECLARILFTSDKAEYFLGLLADGAGSAVEGGLGASVACQSGSAVIERWLRENEPTSDFNPEDVLSWVIEIRDNICEIAKEKALTPRDFACTLLGAVVGVESAVFFQIGDGAIVIGEGKALHPVFWPDNGEYANLTYFITDEDYLQHLHIRVSALPPLDIAMFSDGLQRLALVYETKTAHSPFFEPMFGTIRESANETCDLLSTQLAEFLSSEKINERTDDDKSLILATRFCAVEVRNES